MSAISVLGPGGYPKSSPSNFSQAVTAVTTFNVRIFGYRGLQQLGEPLPGSLNEGLPLRLWQPYEWARLVTTNGINAVFSSPVVNDRAILIKIEVPDGQKVYYEIGPPGRTLALQSGFLEGTQIFEWNPGWVVALVSNFSILTDDTGLISLTADDGSTVLTQP